MFWGKRLQSTEKFKLLLGSGTTERTLVICGRGGPIADDNGVGKTNRKEPEWFWETRRCLCLTVRKNWLGDTYSPRGGWKRRISQKTSRLVLMTKVDLGARAHLDTAGVRKRGVFNTDGRRV